MTKLRIALASTTAMVLAMAAAPAFAQLEEITVTARRVEENLMTTPVSVTAFSSKDIEAMNVKQLIDVSAMTPSFSFTNGTGGSARNDRSATTLLFRGLNVAGGSLFIDGTPVNTSQPPPISDVARIEILKGPQAAYFGRSTFTGAINFITRDPSMTEYKGRISAEYSSWGSNEENISFEGPIVEDKLSARVSGRYFYRGGQYTNAANSSEKLGMQSTKSISGTLVATPTDRLKLKFYFNYFNDSDGTPAQGAIKQDAFNCNVPGAAATSRAFLGYYCGALPTADKIPASQISADTGMYPVLKNVLFERPRYPLIFDPSFNQHFGLERKAVQTHLRLDYEFMDGWNFSNIAAYHRDKSSVGLDLNYRAGLDRPNAAYAADPANRLAWLNFTQWTQGYNRDWSEEFRITSPAKDRIRGTLGASYLNVASPGGVVYGLANTGPNFSTSITRARSYASAVFGGLYFDITPELTLSAEARYQWDKVRNVPIFGTSGQPVTGVAANILRTGLNSFSPRVILDYKFAPNSTAYVTFSRGYRPGGINAALLTSTAATLAALQAAAPGAGVNFKAERLDNWEAGVKTTFLDNRARAVLTVFRDKWVDGQSSASIPINLPATPTAPATTNLIGLTVNSGIATLTGIEAETEFQLTDRFKVGGNLGLNHSKISTSDLFLYNCVDCLNILGNAKLGLNNRMPQTPMWTWNINAEYSAPLAGAYNWYARVDYSHRGRVFTDYSAAAWIGGTDKLNLKLGARSDVLTIEAFVNNLTNDKHLLQGSTGVDVFTFAVPPFKNEIRYSLPLPRSFGIRASYNF